MPPSMYGFMRLKCKIKFVYMEDMLGPRNYGGSPVQRQGRPFLSLRG